jgi:DNA-binding GntR family transcriptional regulator
MWLEILAVREAVPLHTPASLKRVEKSLADAERAMDAGNARAYTRANRALHEALEAPAPEPIRELVRDLWERLWQTRRTTALFETLPERISGAQREHRAVVEAVRAGDAEAAGAAMERHRESTLEAWVEALDLAA